MSVANIQSALITAYLDKFPTLPTAYPNVRFSPPSQGAKWAKIDFTASQPFVFTLGNGGEDMQRGLFVVSFFYPQDTGTFDFYTDVATMREQFVAGKFFTFGGIVTKIISSGANGPVSDGSWLRGMVTIEWESLLARTII